MVYKKQFWNCLGGVVLWLWCGSAFAIDTPLGSNAASASQNFNRNEQQRLLEEQRRRLQELRNLPGKDAEEPATPSAVGGQCFPITDIAFEGLTLLGDETRRQLAQPFLDRCLTIDDLNELLRKVTQIYVDKGYVTTRAYLPQQDLSQKSLKVIVVEGKIESIESQHGSPSSLELNMASPVKVGEPLNLRDLEQMLDQLNRLPSNRVTMDLLPGGTVGGSRIQLDNKTEKPWRLRLGRNNSGSSGTGEQQWSGGLEWDSPLGMADQLIMNFGHDVISQNGQSSSNSYLSYSLPYGYWTFSYSYADSDYASLAEASGFTFELDGTSERHRFQAERLLLRDSISKTSASVSISHLSTRNYIDDTRIEVSSQRLSELGIGLNHGRRIGNALLNIDVGWQRGLTIFGAQHDSNPAPGAPKAQFEKSTLTLSYLRPFVLFDENFRFLSLANGQWSDDVLYSPQRLSIGGQSSVRGFKEQSLSGDSGGYWRNQVTWLKPLNFSQPLFNTMKVALAYDVGVIHHGAYNPELNGRMSGYAVALGLSGKHVETNISFAYALEQPRFFDKKETPIYFSVNFLL